MKIMATIGQEENLNNRSDEISLKELFLKIQEWWRYLLSKWLIIVALGLLGGVLGFWYATTKKNIYMATTTFVLENSDGGGGGLSQYAGLASMAGIDLGGGGGGIFQGDNILGLYKSRTMLEETLLSPFIYGNKNELLVDRYLDFTGLRKKWVEKPELAKLNFKVDSSFNGVRFISPNRLRDSILGNIVNDLNTNYLTVIKPDKKLSAIQVEVKSKDELFAKSFNDALVNNVNEFYINTKTKKTLNNVKILQHKTDSVRNVMNGKIYSAVAAIDATPNLNPTRTAQRVAPSQTAQFSAETNKTILSEMVKNLEVTKMSLLKETPLIQIIDLPIFPLYKEKFSSVKGIVIGGLLFGFLTIVSLVIHRAFKKLMQ